MRTCALFVFKLTSTLISYSSCHLTIDGRMESCYINNLEMHWWTVKITSSCTEDHEISETHMYDYFCKKRTNLRKLNHNQTFSLNQSIYLNLTSYSLMQTLDTGVRAEHSQPRGHWTAVCKCVSLSSFFKINSNHTGWENPVAAF